MQRALAVVAAGAAGALLRYWIGAAVGVRTFPWATLLVNLAGSFALGFVLGGPSTRWSTTTTAAATVGFLGAFTTFSTFAYEATALVRAGRPAVAAGYVTASVLLGLAASAAGFLVGRSAA